MARRPVLCAAVLLAGLSFGETRFDRQVVKVADPKLYQFKELGENKLPTLVKRDLRVGSMVYRGTERYYIEISVTNRSDAAVTLEKDFLKFDKPGHPLLPVNTLETATQLQDEASVSRTVARPVPAFSSPTARSTTTVYSGTATSQGNTTLMNGTATTTRKASRI